MKPFKGKAKAKGPPAKGKGPPAKAKGPPTKGKDPPVPAKGNGPPPVPPVEGNEGWLGLEELKIFQAAVGSGDKDRHEGRWDIIKAFLQHKGK